MIFVVFSLVDDMAILEVYEIYFRCDALFVEAFMHVYFGLFEDVTSISYLFIIIA